MRATGYLLALLFSLSLLLNQCSVMRAVMYFQLFRQSTTVKPIHGMSQQAYQEPDRSEKIQRNRFANRLMNYKSYRRIMGKREPTADETTKWQK